MNPIPSVSAANTVSGTVHGPVVLAGHIDSLTVHHAPPPSVPWQLPLPPHTMIDRGDDRTSLNRALRGDPERQRDEDAGLETPMVLVLHGRAGVGTTALALRWLHDHADRYPDGTLYADLADQKGQDPWPLVTGWLLDLGVRAEDLPAMPDQRLARYRSLTRGRTLAVLLDGATHVNQVLTLLPTGPRCVVVVTSRAQLPGLRQYGAHLHRVHPLTAEHAVALLGLVAGRDRLADDPAAADLVRACGGMPRALTALGSVAADSTVPLAELLAQYDRHRLTTTFPGDSAVSRALLQAYEKLDDSTRRLFGVLAALPGGDFGISTVEAVAASGNRPPGGDEPAQVSPAQRQVELLAELERLRRASLLVARPPSDIVGLDGSAPGPRWTIDQIARTVIPESGDDVDTDVRAAAVMRAADLVWRVLHDADRAVTGYRLHRLSHPSGPPGPQVFDDRGSALAWLETHGHAVGAYARALHELGSHDRAWHLVDGLWPLFLHFKHYRWRAEMHALGLAAAQAWGEIEAQAEMHKLLGMDARSAGSYDDAQREFTTALRLREQRQDPRGRADVLMMLARLSLDIAERSATSDGARATQAQEDAEIQLHTALALYRDTDARREVALTQHLLGELAHARGAYAEAVTVLTLAEVELSSPEVADLYNAARAHAAAGRALIGRKRYDRAEQYLAEALQQLRDLGSVGEQVRVLGYQAELAEAVGDLSARDRLLEEARLLGEAHA